ncbi:MAG: double zinc ribbon domain-containing protein [Candidatus Puniceispirillaceae bacterium]
MLPVQIPDWQKIFAGFFNLVLPQTCPICQSFVTGTGLCLDCWHDLRPIAKPCCAACGRPLVYAMPDSLCAPCLIKPFPLHRIKAGFCYDAASCQLILPFKHADRIDIAPVMVAMLGPAFKQLADKTDIVIPVPLHARRYIKRRYNQSAELARWLCQHHGSNIEFAPQYLLRTKATPSMAGLTKSRREQNVRRAFAIAHPTAKACLAGKDILLIDDVMTTGATLTSCARTLLDAGAASVSALVFARVV